MISKALQFNVSKKIAQLVKVTFFFSAQIEERKSQIKFLNEKYSNEILKLIDESNEKVSGCLESVKGIDVKIYEEVKEKYEAKFKDFFDKNKEYVDNKVAEMNAKEMEISKAISDILQIIPELKNNLENSQNSFNSAYEKKKKELGETVKKLNEIYKQEIDSYNKESEEKLRKYSNEAREKFDRMRDEHTKNIEELKNTNVTPKFSEKQKENLQKQQKRIKELQEKILPLFQEITTLKAKSQVWQRENKNKVNELRKMPIIGNMKNQEIDQMKKNLEDLKVKNAAELKEEKDKLSALKATLEYKMQKVKAEISEEIRKLKEIFDAKAAELKNANSGAVEEINNLLQELKKEYEEQKSRLETKESETTLKLKEKSKNNSNVAASFKSEKKKLKKSKEQVKTQNQTELSEQEEKYKALIENQNKQNNAEKEKLIEEIKKLKMSNGSALSEKQKQLEEEKTLKEEAQVLKEKRLQERDIKDEEEIMKIKEQYEKEVNELKEKLEEEFNKANENKEKEIEAIIKDKQEEQEKLRKRKHDEYEEQMELVRKRFEDKSEYDETQEKYKKKFKELDDFSRTIEAPNINGSESFRNLLKVIDNMKNDIANLKNLIDIERKENERKFNETIDAENERFNEAMRPKTSGRAREQLKNSFTSKINACKEEREAESSKLMNILRDLTNEHDKKMKELNALRMRIGSTEKIDSLSQEVQQQNKESVSEVTKTQDTSRRRIDTSLSNIKKLQEQIQVSIKCLEDEVNRPLSCTSTQREYTKLKEENAKRLEQRRKECDLYIDRMNTDHSMEKSMVLTKTTQQRDKTIASLEAFEEKKKRDSAKYESEIKTRKKSLREELNKMKNDLAALLQFYDEKIAVLTDKRNDLNAKFDLKAPRLCDSQRIEELSIQLQDKVKILKMFVRDFTQYKQLLEKQEGEFNRRFGNSLHIGVPC